MAKSATKYVRPVDWDVIIDAWKMPSGQPYSGESISRRALLERIDVAAALEKLVVISRDVLDEESGAIQFSLIPRSIAVK